MADDFARLDIGTVSHGWVDQLDLTYSTRRHWATLNR
jgi:hypothetical protein